MKLTPLMTDDMLLRELGARLARVRLERNLTQAQLAMEAGISKRTVERIERGEAAAQLSGFLRLCRALELIERIDSLFPPPLPSPVEQLRLRGKVRRRASTPRGAVEEAKPWTWGESPPTGNP
jgi:transcriptional regulator with XRE-family HTH domain